LVTPFKGGRFDEEAFRRLVGRQVQEGTDGLVPCGTTGEAPTLAPEEHAAVVRAAVAEARGRVPVVAGVGTNSTLKTVHQVQEIDRLRPDAFLVTVPYYNRPTQEGLLLHFRAVAAATRKPIVVYNIPGRTGVNLLPATLARLTKQCRNVVALKEAAGSLDQVSEILNAVPASFSVLSGDDSLTLPMMAVGAKGVISVVANLLPRETARLCALALRDEYARAARIHRRLLGLIKALFVETNPIPVKTALSMMGFCSPELRLPLCAMSEKNRDVLRAQMKKFRLL